MTYLIEKRNTVGSYKTIGVEDSLNRAKTVLENEIEDSKVSGWEVPTSFKATEEIPYCFKYGTEHHNITLRIRKI